MCSSASKFKKMEKAIKQTWATNNHPDIKLIFYTDNEKRLFKKKNPILKGWDLILPCKDGYHNCTEKTLQSFEYMEANYNFEYLFRTNLGSYINFPKILAFLTDKPKNQFYCGIKGTFKKDDEVINFASGSGYFLSKDLIELIVSERYSFNHDLIDDVAVGEFMANHHIDIDLKAKRLSYTDNELEYQEGAETLNTIKNSLLYHVRLRSINRSTDIKRMHLLFNSKF